MKGGEVEVEGVRGEQGSRQREGREGKTRQERCVCSEQMQHHVASESTISEYDYAAASSCSTGTKSSTSTSTSIKSVLVSLLPGLRPLITVATVPGIRGGDVRKASAAPCNTTAHQHISAATHKDAFSSGMHRVRVSMCCPKMRVCARSWHRLVVKR